MRAIVKVNVTIHLEDGGEELKHPFAAHLAYEGVVATANEAKAIVEFITYGAHSALFSRLVQAKNMVGGTHKPDLAAAMGGLQEPKRDDN